MSKSIDKIKQKLEGDTAIKEHGATASAKLTTTKTIVSRPKGPQKLKDLPKEAQELMPKEWDKQANIFSPIPSPTQIDPSNVECLSMWKPKTYQNNYFMWAIFNDKELARRMIVAGVDPNVQAFVDLGFRGRKFGRQSPLFAALKHHEDALIVEYLCMANARLDIIMDGSLGGTSLGGEEMFEDLRPLLSILYNDGQQRYLNLPEQALLNHVYFATATRALNAQLRSLLAPNIMPSDLFQIILNYVCEFNPKLMELLEKANYQVTMQTYGFFGALETSLVEPFHQLAKDYFENTQIVQERRARHEVELKVKQDEIAKANAEKAKAYQEREDRLKAFAAKKTTQKAKKRSAQEAKRNSAILYQHQNAAASTNRNANTATGSATAVPSIANASGQNVVQKPSGCVIM